MPNMEAINRSLNPREKDLLEEIAEAISWGAPDHWSTGYSADEFVRLLVRCRAEIRYLRIELKRRDNA